MTEITNYIKSHFARWGLSKLFFYALIVILPLGTRKIFFTPQSYYFGYHSFYNTFYLYLTHLVFLCLILTWLWENLYREERVGFLHKIITIISQDKIYWFTGIFWLILAISLLVSRETYLGLYGLVKITQFILLFAYVRESIYISREIKSIFWLILVTFCFQSALGIWQYVNQSSVGLRLFGEEFLRPGLKGIAEFVSRETLNSFFTQFFPYLSPISDRVINIRAYGTLPHPNILGGLLFIVMMLNILMLYFSREKIKTIVLSFTLILTTTGLVVTFSRLAWGVAGLGIIFWFDLIFIFVRGQELTQMKTEQMEADKHKYLSGKVVLIAILLVAALGLNYWLFGEAIRDRLTAIGPGAGQAHDYAPAESLVNRELYNKIALNMIQAKPVWGVGLKNFVVAMDDYAPERLLPFLHQPVHNIYLLIAAETGILGLFVFLVVSFYVIKNIVRHEPGVLKYTLLIIFFGMLTLGLFDHYFFTIQQGSLMFWLMLGLAATKNQP